jgi:putative ABC transport system permease protein
LPDHRSRLRARDALQSIKPDLAPTLKDPAGSITLDGAPFIFRKLAVASQVALCLLLLMGASLFLRSLANLRSIGLGFKTANVVQFSVAPCSAGYDAARTKAFYRTLDQRLEAVPGVHSDWRRWLY